MRSFIGSLSIDVVFCHEVKPRRRRNKDEDAVDRKAFRVCIFDVDRDRLLDAGAWPDSITISKWFFKQNAETRGDVLAAIRTTTMHVRYSRYTGSHNMFLMSLPVVLMPVLF